jgi:hypothetical protein
MDSLKPRDTDEYMLMYQLQEYAPSRFGLSGKNSARTGSLQLCDRMMGFTSEATFLRSERASSDLG